MQHIQKSSQQLSLVNMSAVIVTVSSKLFKQAEAWLPKRKRDNPLHVAARNRDQRMLAQHYQQGFREVDDYDVLGLTPLHVAVLAGCCDCVVQLLKFGADTQRRIRVDVADGDDVASSMTAAELAYHCGYENIAALLGTDQ